MQGEVGMW